MKFPFGSPSLKLNTTELKSVGKGVLIAIGGALATEITRQLTGASFIIRWHEFQIGPMEFAAGSYNATVIVWVGWSAAINFLRKYFSDNSKNPA